MKKFGLTSALAVAALAGPFALSGAALADALPTPAMAGPLAANGSPFSIDLPDWMGPAGGKVYVGGAVSGLAYWQSNPTFAANGDASSLLDVSNAQVWIEKTDGWFQYYAQFGAYSMPTVGVPYTKATTADPASFGFVPVAYVKLQGQGDWSAFSLEGGKLPTLIGDEYTFTFENMNIERGLLWNVEPAVSTGVQANYSNGPLTVSLSWNDGTYAKVWNWISGLVSYGFNGGADTVAFSGGGNLGSGNFSFLNSGSVYDLIWTHTSGNWVISPYIQFNETPAIESVKGSSVFGAAVLASYSFDDNWKLAGRLEYETESGHANVFTTPDIIGYGPGSNAFSITVTPTYQYKQFFGRAELSYITVGSGSTCSQFGTAPRCEVAGNASDQFRLMFETGVVL
ncbi:MAG TPA: outer membrane beta-barrel protein [Rhizomicrobium sp.]|nr:outer membrane beta-barrel protein [Rhizomicrobium sp.]